MKNKRKKILIWLMIGIVLCTSLISISSPALAANDDYLQQEKWCDNSKVKTLSFNKTAAGSHIVKGTFSYYKDNADMTLYTCFNISNTTLDSEYIDNISVSYTIHSEGEDYKLTVDKDGIRESFGGEDDYFRVNQNFVFDGSAEYCMSYVEYIGNEDKVSFDVSLITDSVFKIKDAIKITRPQKTTTTKPTTTKKKDNNTTKKASKTTTEKRTNKVLDYEVLENKTSTTKKSKTTSNSEASTRYDGMTKASITAPRKTGGTPKSATAETSESTEQGSKSSNARILLYCGIGIITLGFLYLIFLLGREYENKKKAQSDNDSESEE